MKYNLLGQQGIAGERNPDMSLSDDVATYMYDFPPGQGDNEGATTNNKAVNKSDVEDKKVEVALQNPNSYIARNPNIAEKVGSTPSGKVTAKERESEVKDPGFEQRAVRFSTLPKESFGIIDEQINTVQDLQNYSGVINFTTSQKFYLANKLNISPKEIDNISSQKGQGPLQSEANPIAQLEFETDYINNFVANRKKILEEKEKGRDTRTLEQKETDYIKNYLETGVLGPVDFKQDVEDIDYVTQLNQETDYIKNYIDNKVSDGIDNNKSDDAIINDIVEDSKKIQEDITIESDPQIKEPPQGGIQTVDLLNAPDGAYIWNVDGNLYVAYEVPGARGEVYDGPPLFMAYTVPGNNLVEAGLLSPEAPAPFISQLLKEDFDAVTILQSGNTDQLTSLIDHPFASFAEQLESQIGVAPWLADTEMIGLLAEAALEGREVYDSDWKQTQWWNDHTQAEKDWLITYNSDPATAQQLTTDAQIAVANSLQAAGVSNAPEAIINWVADKYISGQWSQAYTTEQVSLFADPYATGKRDENFENYLSSTAITGVDRTSERELEVKELYAKWLGPTLGKLTSEEVSEIAGQLRDDPEYKDSLIQNLKQNRLAAFSAYTNPELTYEDIARPWRNLTTSVWGQTADETQGWWQEMVKTNDFAKAQETLREKGIEQDITQVTQDATKALQQALGQGQVSQSGVNV